MTDIFELNKKTIVSVDKKLRLIVLWQEPNNFSLYIVDLKNNFKELDTCVSSNCPDKETAFVFADGWLEEIKQDMLEQDKV